MDSSNEEVCADAIVDAGEIGRNASFKVFSFADVNDVTVGVVVGIYAGSCWKDFNFVLQLLWFVFEEFQVDETL